LAYSTPEKRLAAQRKWEADNRPARLAYFAARRAAGRVARGLTAVPRRYWGALRPCEGVTRRGEEPMGPQMIPAGMAPCVRCDLPTRRGSVCGFCAAELVREAVA